MRALLIVLAMGFGLAAGWVAVDARESEAEARVRNTACLRDLSHPSLAPLCSYERLWSVPKLTLAAVLGLGAVVALAGVAMTRTREEAAPRVVELLSERPVPATNPPTRRLTPETLLPGEGPEFDRARALMAASMVRGIHLSPEAALASARKALTAERGAPPGHG